MRHSVWAPYRAALAACVAVVSLTALQAPPAAVRAAESSTWYWQNPLPRAYSMSAIACRSVAACVAVGQGGSIATTEDGGRHWTDRHSGTDADPWSVACPARAICYALLSSATYVRGNPQHVRNVMLKSVDGGKTWRQPASPLPASSRQFLDSLACPSATTCLAAGDSRILRTTDGGRTWRAADAPISQDLWAVTCATRTICYAIDQPNRDVVRSGDGGKTWQRRGRLLKDSALYLTGIACPQAETCVVTGSECVCDDAWRALSLPAQQPGPEGDIFLSRDGAKSWKHVAHVAGSELGQDHLLGVDHDIVCPSATTCYALAGGSVIRTTDGGRAWSPPLPGGGSDIACPRPTTCYAAAGFVVLKTRDGFDHTEETLAHSAIHVGLADISCPSASMCYAGGGGFAATTDGGRTWRDRPKSPPMVGFSCPSPTVCYAVSSNSGEAALYRSGDGAKTWQQLKAPVRTSDVRGVTCANVTTCYVTSSIAGPDGPRLAVLVTRDGGAMWSVKTGIDAAARSGSADGNASITPGGVSCPSATICFATAIRWTYSSPTGQDLVVLSTTDGGETWTAHTPASGGTTGGPVAWLALACPTATTCYVVPADEYQTDETSRGVVLVTRDAGAIWHSTVVTRGAALNVIACAAAQACRVSGPAGIFATEDSGMTWQRQLLEGGEKPPWLSAIACPAVDTCYAVGGLTIVATHRLQRQDPPHMAFTQAPDRSSVTAHTGPAPVLTVNRGGFMLGHLPDSVPGRRP